MLTALEQKRMRDLITETVTLLCKSSLKFRSKITVEGLLGITIDDRDVLLINIHEVVSSLKGKTHSLVKDRSCHNVVRDNENSSLSKTHVMGDSMQSRKRQNVKKSSSWQTDCSEPCSTSASERMLLYDKLDEEIAHSFRNEGDNSTRSFPAEDKSLDVSSSLPLIAGANKLVSDTSNEVCELQDHSITVKEENISETDVLYNQFDCGNHDLHVEYNSNWSDEEDTHIQVRTNNKGYISCTCMLMMLHSHYAPQ